MSDPIPGGLKRYTERPRREYLVSAPDLDVVCITCGRPLMPGDTAVAVVTAESAPFSEVFCPACAGHAQ